MYMTGSKRLRNDLSPEIMRAAPLRSPNTGMAGVVSSVGARSSNQVVEKTMLERQRAAKADIKRELGDLEKKDAIISPALEAMYDLLRAGAITMGELGVDVRPLCLSRTVMTPLQHGQAAAFFLAIGPSAALNQPSLPDDPVVGGIVMNQAVHSDYIVSTKKLQPQHQQAVAVMLTRTSMLGLMPLVDGLAPYLMFASGNKSMQLRFHGIHDVHLCYSHMSNWAAGMVSQALLSIIAVNSTLLDHGRRGAELRLGTQGAVLDCLFSLGTRLAQLAVVMEYKTWAGFSEAHGREILQILKDFDVMVEPAMAQAFVQLSLRADAGEQAQVLSELQLDAGRNALGFLAAGHVPMPLSASAKSTGLEQVLGPVIRHRDAHMGAQLRLLGEKKEFLRDALKYIVKAAEAEALEEYEP